MRSQAGCEVHIRIDVVSDAIWFPHRLQMADLVGTYVRTTVGLLRSTAFIDGRQPFWSAEKRERIEINENGKTALKNQEPTRFIFHVSFCGSTLLAQLLDCPGKTLALKEPKALIDLSDQLVALPRSDRDSVAHVVTRLLCELTDLQGTRENVIIKPSNWCNAILPDLCSPSSNALAVFLSIDRREFLKAVFRGGRDRMAYVARATEHFVASQPDAQSWLNEAVAGAADVYDQIARIAALNHALQERAFREIIALRAWNDECWIDYATIADAPQMAAERAAKVLGLNLTVQEIAMQATKFVDVHAKDRTLKYDQSRRREEDDEILKYHGAYFDKAIAWVSSLGME